MAELVLNDLVKIYPYTKIGGLFGARRRSVEALRQEKMNPYTTNEGVIAVQQFSLEIEQCLEFGALSALEPAAHMNDSEE